MSIKTIIITGGGQGIGKVIAETFLTNGHQVVILENDKEAGEETARELEILGPILFIPTDISREDQVIEAIDKVIAEFKAIDILINNAAISANKNLTELSLDEWNYVIGVNLTGTFLCTKYALPYIKKSKGSIINMCSTRAFMSEADTEAYSASKGGIFALTHALAISLGPDVRVNSISPGWIDVTPLQKKSNRNPYRFRKTDHEQHPSGSVGNAKDIASAVMFLTDEKNRFITGENIIIDGGMTRKMIYA